MLHRGSGPQDKENLRPAALLCSRSDATPAKGVDVGTANYKARLDLRVSLPTHAKLCVGVTKGNKG